MRRRGSLIPVFSIFFLTALLIFFLSLRGILNGTIGVIEMVTVPVQREVFGSSHRLITENESSEMKKLRDENLALTQQLVKEKELEKENAALRDQFQVISPSSVQLVPAHIIGMSGFLPGISQPDSLLIDQGTAARVTKGDAVVFKDNFIGTVEDISLKKARVALLRQKTTSFTVQTLKTSALGILKAQGDDSLLLDNVVLSDTVTVGDLVITKGDEGGLSQIPQGLIVGKITSVNKKTSNLFQTGEVASLVDVKKLDMVFIVTGR